MKKPGRRKKIIISLVIVIVLVVVLRILLPFAMLSFANRKLATMRGYYGQVKDIDVFLIRGSYSLDSMFITKVDTNTLKQTPFFAADKIDLSIEWSALFYGSLVGEVIVNDAHLTFTKDKIEPAQLVKDSVYFKEILNVSMPLKINRFEVTESVLRYIDHGSNPPVDIEMTQIFLVAENLRNSYDSTRLLPASITGTAALYEGAISYNMKLDPLQGMPTFDMNLELKRTNLVKLNDFFQAYARVDVNKGTFGLYMEVAAKEGRFAGYMKPVIEHLDILGKEDRGDNLFRQLWEAAVGGAGQVFRNQRLDQIATRILLEGEIDDPDRNVWYAIANILRNAFVKALRPAIENEINIKSVSEKKKKKGFLENVFEKRKIRKSKANNK